MGRLRDQARTWGRDLAGGAAALLMALAGLAFLFAAGFGLLMRAVGGVAACGLVGLVLLILAALILTARILAHQKEEARAKAAADPMRDLVFDLAVMAGRAISARRRKA